MMNCPHCNVHIDEHPASKCLNIWVATDVMELRYEGGVWYYPPYEWGMTWLREYSANISAAWEVVEKLTLEWRFRLTHDTKRAIIGEKPYRAAFCKWGTRAHRDYAKTAPLAICRAGIKTVISVASQDES